MQNRPREFRAGGSLTLIWITTPSLSKEAAAFARQFIPARGWKETQFPQPMRKT
jgi:hypothetical protein